jgi:hypothetical protein
MDYKQYKKPRATCPACGRVVSRKEAGGLGAHHCTHGNQCVEPVTGAKVLDCELCAKAAAVAS